MLVYAHLRKTIFTVAFLFTNAAIAQEWSLKMCIDTALAYNKTLKISAIDMNIADKKHREMIGNLYPKIQAGADYRYYSDLPYQLLPASVFNGPPGVYKEAQFGVPHNLNASISIELPVFNAQTLGSIKTSEQLQHISLTLYRQAEEQVVLNVSNLFYNIQLIQFQTQFVESGIENSERLLTNIKLLQSHQMARQTDVDKISLQVSQLQSQLKKLKAQHQQLLNLIKLHLGMDPSKDLIIEAKPPAVHELKLNSLKPSLESKLADNKHKLLKRELQAIRLSYLPSVSLYGSYGTTGYGNYNGTTEFQKFYPSSFMGIKVSWLLFPGTTLLYKAQQKNDELRQSEIRLEALNEKQKVENENASLQYASAVSDLNLTSLQLEQAKAIYSKSIIQHKEGIASLTDILIADNAHKEAQQNYLSSLINIMKAELELKKTSGNLLNDSK